MVGHSGEVRSVSFSPDGSRLASASTDGTIRIWDVAKGDTLLVLRDHREAVYAVTFSPDGAFLVSGSADRTARLWHTAASL